jgi:hypothetical protein
MKAKAENGCVNCLVGIPRCLKNTVKKLFFYVAGLVQYIVCMHCMPKLMDKAEMQTQINPEKQRVWCEPQRCGARLRDEVRAPGMCPRPSIHAVASPEGAL